MQTVEYRPQDFGVIINCVNKATTIEVYQQWYLLPLGKCLVFPIASYRGYLDKFQPDDCGDGTPTATVVFKELPNGLSVQPQEGMVQVPIEAAGSGVYPTAEGGVPQAVAEA